MLDIAAGSMGISVFQAPFVIAWRLLALYFDQTFGVKVLIAIGLLTWIAVTSFQEAGPFKVASLARRFSWGGYPLAAFLFWWTWMAVVPPVFDVSLKKAWWLSVLTIVWVCYSWYILAVVLRGHKKGCWLRAYRRMRFRLRWDSIAKSARLSHIRDARPFDWATGGTEITVVGLRVQWVPTLWHGRRSKSGTGTDYLYRPARGESADKVGAVLEGIAISANADSATFSPRPVSDRKYFKNFLNRNWWTLTLYWTDPAEARPDLNWHSDDPSHSNVIDVNSRKVA